jgi:adenylate cyclase
MSEAEVWLESRDGRRWPISMTCAIGRSATNDIVLEDGRVSRRHALVHRQGETEHWVIDLGSGNGTYINGRRVTLATRIHDGDELTIGATSLVFRQRISRGARTPTAPVSEQTLIQVKALDCWLLVADIKGSTALTQRLPPTELAVLVGKWIAGCKEIIEREAGAINKYLGDGFFAYWIADARGSSGVTRALPDLVVQQRSGQGPPFRLALHKGIVTVGGGASAGEDSLSGNDVIRVFRMEKLASALKEDILISAEARRDLSLSCREIGSHRLESFDDEDRPFFTLA